VVVIEISNVPAGVRAAVLASLIRDDGVVTRRDEPQSIVEAVPPQLSGSRTPSSTAGSTMVLVTVSITRHCRLIGGSGRARKIQ
jgi:hypothetical protein